MINMQLLANALDPERNAAIIRAREAGASLGALARLYGLSRERIRQIVIQYERRATRRPRAPYCGSERNAL